jgi:leader peptidase (prepilin peptidase)/N-methyltransferase
VTTTAALALACTLLGVALGPRLAAVIDRAVAARARVPAGVLSGAVDVPAFRPVSRNLVQILTGTLLGTIAWQLGWGWELPAYLVLAGFLVVLSLIDLATKTLPRRIVYAAGWSGVALLVPAAVLTGAPERIVWGAVGAIASLVALWLLHEAVRGGLGFGDVRLGVVLGWYLGWQAMGLPLVALFLAFLLSALAGLALVALRRAGRRSALPFGPFMAAAAVLALVLH